MPDVGQPVAQTSPSSSTRSALLPFLIVLVVILVLLALASLFKGKSTSPTTVPTTAKVTGRPPSPTPRAMTKLSLDPAVKTLKVGDVLTIAVMTSGEGVQAVDVVLTYDPAVFQVGNVQKGEVFSEILQNRLENGRIFFSASVNPQTPKITANGTIFTVDLTPLSATATARVDFDRALTITAKAGENTLGETVGGRYIVE